MTNENKNIEDEKDILHELLAEIRKLNSSIKPHDKDHKSSNDTIVVVPEPDENSRGTVVFEKNDFNQMIYTKVIKLESSLNEMFERWLEIHPVLNDVKKLLLAYQKIDIIETDISTIKKDFSELRKDVSELNDKIKNHKTFSQFLKEKSEFSENFTKIVKFIFYLLLGLYLLFNVTPELGTILKILNGGGSN